MQGQGGSFQPVTGYTGINGLGTPAIAGLKVPNNVTFTELSLYVGDLDPNVTDVHLAEFFMSRYPSLVGAKVIVDGSTRISKGYGFVKFGRNDEYQKALMEMPGQMLLSRPMKIKQTHARSQTGTETNVLASILALNSLSNSTGIGEMNNPANPILSLLSSTLNPNNGNLPQMPANGGQIPIFPFVDSSIGGVSEPDQNEGERRMPNIPMSSLPPHLQEYYTALAYARALTQPKKNKGNLPLIGVATREAKLVAQMPGTAYLDQKLKSFM
jgi:RNA recognition motif-containing protein